MWDDLIRNIREGKKINENLFLSYLQKFAEDFYKRHIYRNKIKVSKETIEDLVQDFILKIWENDFLVIKRLKDPEKCRSYFTTILRNLLLSKLNGPKQESLTSYGNESEQNSGKDIDIIFEGNQDDFLACEEIIKILNNFLESINKKRDCLIFLYKLRDLKATDIAKQLNLTEENVNTIFSRLKEKLVSFFENYNLLNVDAKVQKYIYNWLINALEKKIEDFEYENES